jgi:hypothetical protein
VRERGFKIILKETVRFIKSSSSYLTLKKKKKKKKNQKLMVEEKKFMLPLELIVPI